MSQKLYDEEYHFNKEEFDPNTDKIQFYCAFRSVWQPGFVTHGNSGHLAIYTLIKQGTSTSCPPKGPFATGSGANHFTFSRKKFNYTKSFVTSSEALVRKAIMVYPNAFHEMLTSHFFKTETGKLYLKQPERVEAIFDEIYEILGQDQPDTAKLSGLFLQMLQEVHDQQQENPYPEALNHALHFIRDNLHDPALSKEMIAEHCDISTRTLSRLFRKFLNCPATQYIIHTRLEKVSGMLSMPRLSIREIARLCGYKNSAYLTRQFSHHYVKRPSNTAVN
jgi:AraC-like DNA-binding protein